LACFFWVFWFRTALLSRSGFVCVAIGLCGLFQSLLIPPIYLKLPACSSLQGVECSRKRSADAYSLHFTYLFFVDFPYGRMRFVVWPVPPSVAFPVWIPLWVIFSALFVGPCFPPGSPISTSLAHHPLTWLKERIFSGTTPPHLPRRICLNYYPP